MYHTIAHQLLVANNGGFLVEQILAIGYRNRKQTAQHRIEKSSTGLKVGYLNLLLHDMKLGYVLAKRICETFKPPADHSIMRKRCILLVVIKTVYITFHSLVIGQETGIFTIGIKQLVYLRMLQDVVEATKLLGILFDESTHGLPCKSIKISLVGFCAASRQHENRNNCRHDIFQFHNFCL